MGRWAFIVKLFHLVCLKFFHTICQRKIQLSLQQSLHTLHKHDLLLEYVLFAIKIGIFSRDLIINGENHSIWKQGSAGFTAICFRQHLPALIPELERTCHAFLMITCSKIGRHMNHWQQVYQQYKTYKNVQTENHPIITLYQNPLIQ